MRTPFNRAFRTSSILLIVSLAGMVGCGLLKKKGADADDAAAEAAVAEAVDAAPAPVAAPIAANVDDVARFPDEKPIDNVAATILRNGTNVREIPSVGKVVATLAKGGTVTQLASRGTAILVVFENPKDQKKLMGWVGQEAFTAPADAGIKVLTCAAPDVALLSDGPFCGRICTSDTDCPGGQACKGAANKFTNAKLGDAVTVCTVFTAGGRGGPVAAVTTGAAVTPPPPPPPPVNTIPIPNTDVSDAVAGKCPIGFTLVSKDLKCHKICSVGQCRVATRFCTPCNGTNVCASTLTFCK